MTTNDLARTFTEASSAGDADTLRVLLADDVTFTGPVASTSGVEETVDGLVEMSRIAGSQRVKVQLIDDENVLTWADVSTPGRTTPTATWLKVANGRITAIETVFNAGPR